MKNSSEFQCNIVSNNLKGPQQIIHKMHFRGFSHFKGKRSRFGIFSQNAKKSLNGFIIVEF